MAATSRGTGKEPRWPRVLRRCRARLYGVAVFFCAAGTGELQWCSGPSEPTTLKQSLKIGVYGLKGVRL
jgi:hypothetical protein